jgi:hypothetical protein
MFKFSGKTEAAPAPETKGKEAPANLPYPNPSSILKMKPSLGEEKLQQAVAEGLLTVEVEADEPYEG